jgi:hypothetical protein
LKLVVEIVKFIKTNFSSSTDAGFKEEIQLEGLNVQSWDDDDTVMGATYVPACAHDMADLAAFMNWRTYLEKTHKVK